MIPIQLNFMEYNFLENGQFGFKMFIETTLFDWIILSGW